MIVAVVHLIHVNTPHQHIPKLFVKGVPGDAPNLKPLLEGKGYQFGEFGIPWANHYLQEGLRDAEDGVKGAWTRGDVETIDYADLLVDWGMVDQEN